MFTRVGPTQLSFVGLVLNVKPDARKLPVACSNPSLHVYIYILKAAEHPVHSNLSFKLPYPP